MIAPGTRVIVEGVADGDRHFNGMIGHVIEHTKPKGYVRIKPEGDYTHWQMKMVGHDVLLHPESLKEHPDA